MPPKKPKPYVLPTVVVTAERPRKGRVPKAPPAPDYPGPMRKAMPDTTTHEEPASVIGRLVKFVKGGYTK